MLGGHRGHSGEVSSGQADPVTQRQPFMTIGSGAYRIRVGEGLKDLEPERRDGALRLNVRNAPVGELLYDLGNLNRVNGGIPEHWFDNGGTGLAAEQRQNSGRVQQVSRHLLQILCFPFRPPLGKQLVNDTAALKVRPKPLLDLADHSQAAASQSDPIVVYVQDYILARCQAEFLSQFGDRKR